jgi:hypothetical protein
MGEQPCVRQLRWQWVGRVDLLGPATGARRTARRLPDVLGPATSAYPTGFGLPDVLGPAVSARRAACRLSDILGPTVSARRTAYRLPDQRSRRGTGRVVWQVQRAAVWCHGGLQQVWQGLPRELL